VVVGVNKWTEGEPSPLMGEDGGIMVVDPGVEADQIARLQAWRDERDEAAVDAALAELRAAAQARARTSCPPRSRRQGGRDHRRMGGRDARGAWRISRAHGRVARPSNRTEGLDDLRAAVDAVSDQTWPAAEIPGRQAGA
jgi:(2R)-ethylmalonyl-CoA mutase